ncbi:Starch-binding associating with outer membrane [Spirosomataceae bacterium TFI 002]|nr:Starch-binding associating with outer membrane [Spirosomataceae bacterium TFI 002]
MKKLIILFLAIGLSSCDDFLKENVRGIISPNNFYNSDPEAIQAANGLYVTYREDVYRNWAGITTWQFFGTDEIMPSRIFGGLAAVMDYNLTETNYANAYGMWQDLYRVVGDANSVIANLKDNDKISIAVKDRSMGEAYFLRALAYHNLTSIWGDVPFYTEELTLAEVGVLGRTDKSQIRTAMIEDLKIAEGLLPSSYTGSDIGRSSKWAAKFLRTRLHLWLEEWQEALDACKDIINNSPHKLMPTYGEIFDVNNQFNEEAIFGWDHLTGVQGQTITDSFNPRLRDEPRNSAQRNEFAGVLASRGEEFNGYGLAVPSDDAVAKHPNDLRKPYNLMDSYLGYDLTYTYLKKRTNFDFVQSPRGGHGEWWITMRMGQVYLMAAEAANEVGDASAYDYINAIRDRAYEEDASLSGLSKDEFRKAVQDELKWELLGETERKYDLVRWGIFYETIKNTNYGRFSGSENVQPHMQYAPIPAEEIVLNPALLESDPTNNGYR